MAGGRPSSGKTDNSFVSASAALPSPLAPRPSPRSLYPQVRELHANRIHDVHEFRMAGLEALTDVASPSMEISRRSGLRSWRVASWADKSAKRVMLSACSACVCEAPGPRPSACSPAWSIRASCPHRGTRGCAGDSQSGPASHQSCRPPGQTAVVLVQNFFAAKRRKMLKQSNTFVPFAPLRGFPSFGCGRAPPRATS